MVVVNQHIIVEDENAATKAIDFKRNRAGRATFLPFDDYHARTISSQESRCLSQQVQASGMADELVSFDKRLGFIFKNLLTTAIFDSVEHAACSSSRSLQVRTDIDGNRAVLPGGSYGIGKQARITAFLLPETGAITKEIVEEEASLQPEEATL